MTVTTVFASTDDGYLESQNASYTAARAGSGVLVDNTDTFVRVGQYIFGVYVVAQAFMRFDTSAIPVTDLVSSAALELFWTVDQTAANFTLRVRAFDWAEPLSAGDFVPGASISTTGTHVASLAAGGGVLGTYLTFIDVDLPANINKGGVTELYFYSLEQENNSAPAGNEFVEFSSADETGTGQDPKITITHASTVSSVPRTLPTNRIWSTFQ